MSSAAQGECHICQSACGVDLAGAILMKIYPDVQPTSRESLLSAREAAKVQGLATRLSAALSSKLVTFSQSKLIEQKFGAKDAGAWASFADNGYLYVPEACQSGAPCRLHVAFHGCKQGGDNDPPFGNIFARFAGYNEWAKNNRIVVQGLSPRLRRLRNVVTGRVGQDRTYSEHPALKVRHDRLSALAHRVSARLPG